MADVPVQALNNNIPGPPIIVDEDPSDDGYSITGDM